jgi:ferredoxin
MKASIRYFSGTGNSWRIASECAERFRAAGYATDMESIRRERPPDPAADAVGFCFPVHALDLPPNAVSYLRGLPVPARRVPVLLIVTGGNLDNCGWALETGARLLDQRGYTVRIGELIRMPINWTPFHSAPEDEENKRMIAEGVRRAGGLGEEFLEGKSRMRPRSLRTFGPAGSVLMRTLYHRRGVYQLWKFFETGSRCNGCGLCARLCPTASIRLQDVKPVWSGGCVQCMRCFNFCPNRAIRQLDFLLHGSRHRAYRLPGFNPNLEKNQT